MKRSLCIVSHGPELRNLEVLKKVRNCTIDVAIKKNIYQVINNSDYPEVSKWYVLPEISKSKNNKKAERLVSIIDVLYRRLSLKKGLYSFSYTRKNVLYDKKNNFFFNYILYYIINIFFYFFTFIVKLVLQYFFRNIELINFFKNVNDEELIVFEHLGSKDIYTFNASTIKGFKIICYLNNHKDISIRPYLPIAVNEFHVWFNSQKNSLFKVFNSSDKIKVNGLIRVNFWKDIFEQDSKNDKDIFNILYTCSDPKRRPYEIYSLTNLCTQLQTLKPNFKLNIRLNPMDKSDIFSELNFFEFVNIIHANWYWDGINFINFPTKESEKEYFQLLNNSDLVVSLPSTTIVEGDIFNKNTICLLDSNSPDKKEEKIEMNLVLPFEIIKSEKFSIANNIYDIKSQIKESLNNRFKF